MLLECQQCILPVDLLDIPVYKNKVHSLHVLFTLYMEFKNSQVSNSCVRMCVHMLCIMYVHYYISYISMCNLCV